MAQCRVTRSGYRTWLQSLPADTVIGEVANCYGCPLATWLTALLGVEDGHVWVGERTWYDRQDRRHVLPRWAQMHVRQVDRSGVTRITAGMALAWLEAV